MCNEGFEFQLGGKSVIYEDYSQLPGKKEPMEYSTAERVEAQERLTVSAAEPQNAEGNQNEGHPQPRLVGSPLPVGTGASGTQPQSYAEPNRGNAAPAPGRALVNQAGTPARQRTGLERAVNALRAALPLVQRLLPLLDGNIGTAFSNILNPPQKPAPALEPAPPVNLAPIEHGLAELRKQHGELRDHFLEQNSSLKRVEDQLEMVREATDRNTLEQQELLEDLKAVGSKVNLVALIAIGLLAFSTLINLLLYLHIQRVLP